MRRNMLNICMRKITLMCKGVQIIMGIAIQCDTNALLERFMNLESNFNATKDVDDKRYYFNVAYIVYTNYRYNNIYDVDIQVIDTYLANSRFYRYVMRVRDSAENVRDQVSNKQLLESELNLVYKHLENVQRLLRKM